MSRSLKAHLLLVLATLIWGATFVVVKAALQFASPLTFTTIRMTVAAVFLVLVFRKSLPTLTRPSLYAGCSVGVLLFLGYAFQTTGLNLTTPSKSAFLTSSSFVLVPLLLLVFWRIRIDLWRITGIATALAGLFLMTVPAGDGRIADLAKVNAGDLLTLIAVVAFALQLIVVGPATQRFPFQQIVTIQIAVAALLMGVAAPLVETPHLQPSVKLAAAILVTGALPTAVAFSLQAWAQQFIPATHTAVIFTLEPVFAWLTSLIVMKERLGIRAGVGALLILAGVLISALLARPSQLESSQLEATQLEASRQPEPQPGNERPLDCV
ncbi:MAG TPA: DMT family transporter [Candidatus Solibacter sp.]|nr:DMT family transporter [Candidatus Solibacter sp.]